MKSREEFDRWLDQTLRARLKELSKARQKALKQKMKDYGEQEQYKLALEAEVKRHGVLAGHRRHNRLGGLYDNPANVVMLAVGIGVLAFLLWPKKAKAQTPAGADTKKDTPTPAPAAGSTTTLPSPGTPKFQDPATGTTIDGPSGKIGAGTAYAIQKGESWSNIASRVFGDYRWWPFLWDYNRTAQTFQNPDKLNVGDSISIPASTPKDAAYQRRIFERAAAHRKYWLDKAAGKSVTMPAIVSEQTPVPL